MPTDFSRKFVTGVFAASLAVAAIGCDRGIPIGAVEGRVTKDGQPQKDLWVKFQPEGGRPGEGRTDADGRFRLTYSQDKQGALVGQHTVHIYSGGEVDHRDNQLSPRVEVHSEEVEVVDGDNNFEFKLP